MPKIFENVREQLLAEAKRQIKENGYAKTTIRSVAGACSLGVGTVYNYFSSKDMLIASFMLEDWQVCLERMRGVCYCDERELLLGIYELLCDFIGSHRALFEDSDAIKSFNSSHTSRHSLLRKQIALTLYPVCNNRGVDADFLSEFVAESLLSWTVEGKGFDEIYSVMKLLFK